MPGISLKKLFLVQIDLILDLLQSKQMEPAWADMVLVAQAAPEGQNGIWFFSLKIENNSETGISYPS